LDPFHQERWSLHIRWEGPPGRGAQETKVQEEPRDQRGRDRVSRMRVVADEARERVRQMCVTHSHGREMT
jgi:hypothetical protein